MIRSRALVRLGALVAGVSAIVVASPGLAWELRLVQTTPGGANPAGGVGSLVAFDLLISSDPFDDYVQQLSVGLSFDPTIIAYRSDLSDANDYYPLYVPSAGCKSCTESFHVPVDDPPAPWGNPPPGRQQVNFASYEVNLSGPAFQTWSFEDEWLATLVFEQVGPGSWLSGFRFDLEHDGNVFVTHPSLADERDQVATTLVLSPEPSTVLLLSVGLLALGVTTRR